MSQPDILLNQKVLKCRGCLTEEPNMNSLFTNFLKDKNLANIIEESTGYVVTTERERFSQHLCKECTRIIVDFVKFKVTFQDATRYFENLCVSSKIRQNTKDINCKKFDNECKEGNHDFTLSGTKTGQRKDDISQNVESNSVLQDGENSDNFVVLLSKDQMTPSTQKSKKIKCDMCDEHFKSKLQLQRHKKIVHRKTKGRKQPKRCTLKLKKSCKESDVFILQINTSLKKVSYNPNSKQLCKICKEEFPAEEFDYHFESHKTHICNTCGHRFIRKTDLNDHQETHLDICKYVCQHCGKAFKVRTALNKHRRIHTNPREEICDVCGQRFNTRDTLKTHYKLKHVKSKEFQCNLCGLAFTLKSTLEKHIERHNPNRQRIYSCNLCSISYINKYNLSRHHVIKHTTFENRPTCEFCGKGYVKKIDLVKHVKKHHGQNNNQDKICQET